ncbi:MAG: SDR family oxidoreductase [Acidimicrobiales bacterium]|nr:SDR family oxidoreductase [Acidimicrobiales bacterium]
MSGAVLVVGGTSGIGLEIARHYLDQGREVVITGSDDDRCRSIADDLGPNATGIGFDLAEPSLIAPALADVGPVSRLVLAAIARDANSVREYSYERAIKLATMKLVSYTEVIHTLVDRFTEDASIVLFGGRAKDRPYPGSTTVTTVNGAVTSMVVTLALELAPTRVNALHPGIVGDSPFWKDKDLSHVVARTPTGKLTTMADVVDATVFLLENESINGINLHIDGGWMLM